MLVVAYAFVCVMALSSLPAPLYVLYQAREGFSNLTITVIFAAYAVGVVASLFLAGHLSDVHGRRRLTLAAISLNLVAVTIYLAWPELPGLLLARAVGGLGVGAITATATAWIIELHASPGAPPQRAQAVATAANLGGIGLGPLVGGVLAQWVAGPLTTPYVVLLCALALAFVLVLLVPETRPPVRPSPPYRPQRVAVPRDALAPYAAAAIAAAVGFSLLGMFTSLAPAFIAGTLGHGSRALAGAVLFVVFVAAATAQVAAGARPPRAVLSAGLAGLFAGSALLVAAVWLPSLAVFLAGGVAGGAGAGLTLKGALGTAAELAAPEQRAEALAGVFLTGYLGLSVPVIALGALTQELAADVSLTLFAAVIALGVLGVAALLGGRRRVAVFAPTA